MRVPRGIDDREEVLPAFEKRALLYFVASECAAVGGLDRLAHLQESLLLFPGHLEDGSRRPARAIGRGDWHAGRREVLRLRVELMQVLGAQ